MEIRNKLLVAAKQLNIQQFTVANNDIGGIIRPAYYLYYPIKHWEGGDIRPQILLIPNLFS